MRLIADMTGTSSEDSSPKRDGDYAAFLDTPCARSNGERSPLVFSSSLTPLSWRLQIFISGKHMGIPGSLRRQLDCQRLEIAAGGDRARVRHTLWNDNQVARPDL